MTSGLQPLSTSEYKLLNELISECFGISFPEDKKNVLERRLRPRLHALRLAGYMDYYLLLLHDFESEQAELTRLITNNETYFFRETYQFDALFDDGLERLAAGSPGRLRVLCAGCSSGEEPYTLNIFAHESPGVSMNGGLSIDSFDIDCERVAKASRASYGPNSLRATSERQIRTYFSRVGSDLYELLPRYRERIRFSHGNILDLDSYPSRNAYDVIFCRNVLIYFSEPAIHRTIDNFARALRPGGILFLGHSESIIGVSPKFETIRLKRCIAYQRAEQRP